MTQDGANGTNGVPKVNGTNGTHSNDAAPKASPFGSLNDGLDYDVLIIGAGLSGIYAMYRMAQLGLRAKVLEAGASEGGTWFWNRYPGARFDSESYSYIFSFSPEILAEWDWTEHFAPQPETLRYIEFVTRKLDLRKHMQFDTRIRRAQFAERARAWTLTDDQGRTYTSRYLITAIGILNEPTLPDIPGVHTYQGEAWHTARWPQGGEDRLAGKRVGVIGTGATAIQTIQTIAPTVGSLTVFQRTPNWTAPLRNATISKAEMAAIRARYPEIFRKCAESASCFVHVGDDHDTVATPAAERERHWEQLYAQRGFSKVLAVSRDIATSREANALYSAFHEKKIRARIQDPKVADLLIPTDHGFGTRRTPLESGYYEVFNQANVTLVDVRRNPIERITATGVHTSDGRDYDVDVLVYATGFDAVTGSFNAIDFEGIGGTKLRDVWGEGIKTYLGLTVKNFPNMFMIMGPHQTIGNVPRSIEYAVQWTAEFIEWAAAHQVTYCEATDEGVAAWTEHVHECGKGLLANEVDSWMTGVNKNLAHKQKRSMTRYTGPAPGYRKRCEEVKEQGYSTFVLRKGGDAKTKE
ncbi:monooxygenase [Sporothrix schenckii 1099-18]|uniref:Monooxygenase n=1 Tax=Sporothrix schenckii 1099-18 TaxID=1397361 RepID=A0A0F2M6G5_SPOSC|nr:monooxygenase [Sporothrix schenckii 1099-18]KJR85283.1 monooxygenase [Sporothrix schenckii 1099-18]